MSGFEKYSNGDGTYDGVAALVDVSGIPRLDVLEMVAKAKANHTRLEACKGHDFAPAEGNARVQVCRNCGGEASKASVVWYEAGARHADARR